VDLLPTAIEETDRPPFERVPVRPDPLGHPCPDAFRDKILIDVIHDGSSLPRGFRDDVNGRSILENVAFPSQFQEERDWGAELVARCLASALDIPSYHRVTTARTLLDFGRFPGISPKGAKHLQRYAISHPFSERLTHHQKRSLLTDHYDVISDGMERALRGKCLKIAIHTYDKRNPTQFERPAVSLLTRPFGYQELVPVPFPHFDPTFPAKVVEYTADRLLKARIAQTLEESAVHTADNFPYSLPEGSVEVRAQVWYFFRHVREIYTASLAPRPMSLVTERCPRELVWEMLLDTNLRSSESEALRSYLHMFRNPPAGKEVLFRAAQEEYQQIQRFINRERAYLVNSYREGNQRPSTLIIELRKDLVWEFDDGVPVGPRIQNAQFLARRIALGVAQYLSEDRAFKERSSLNQTFLS
jgi:hypothetical protein